MAATFIPTTNTDPHTYRPIVDFEAIMLGHVILSLNGSTTSVALLRYPPGTYVPNRVFLVHEVSLMDFNTFARQHPDFITAYLRAVERALSEKWFNSVCRDIKCKYDRYIQIWHGDLVR